MRDVARHNVTVVGGGVVGLWQALTLAQRGHEVVLREAAGEDATGAASRLAGAMLAPYCEAEAAEPIVLRLGLGGLAAWRRAGVGVEWRGTLVLATSRDESELKRFARATQGHEIVTAAGIAELEPALAGRFNRGLFFAEEGHMAPRRALAGLAARVRESGGRLQFASPVPGPIWMAASAGDLVIDCRGMAARDDLPELRGVRGEMVVVEAKGVRLSRPVRLLHPRFPIYVVPWGAGLYMIGATMIESESAGPITLRSGLELLGSACALHPAFAEARLVEMSAGVRPAFPDNLPMIVRQGRRLMVNGAYRHGFLLAPVLAEAVAGYLETGELPAGVRAFATADA